MSFAFPCLSLHLALCEVFCNGRRSARGSSLVFGFIAMLAAPLWSGIRGQFREINRLPFKPMGGVDFFSLKNPLNYSRNLERIMRTPHHFCSRIIIFPRLPSKWVKAGIKERRISCPVCRSLLAGICIAGLSSLQLLQTQEEGLQFCGRTCAWHVEGPMFNPHHLCQRFSGGR